MHDNNSTDIPADSHVIIIGAMKCGTSSLFSYLAEHPMICPSFTKEPEYFSQKQGHKVHITSYSDLWDFNANEHKYAIEASTGYTKYPTEKDVPKRIFEYGIRPKFIYVIRNPFDRITSHFNFMEMKDGWDLNINDRYLIDGSKYFLQLEQYRQFFPKEDILILDFDDLKRDIRIVLDTTFQFLKLQPHDYHKEFEIKNATQLESTVETHLRQSKFNPLLKKLPRPLKDAGKRLLRHTFPKHKRKLTSKERTRLQELLNEDMLNLSRTYGFNVGKWGFDS